MGDRLWRRHLRHRAALSCKNSGTAGLQARPGRQRPVGADHAGAAAGLTGRCTKRHSALTCDPNRTFADHLLDRRVPVAEFAQHVTRMFAGARRRAADHGFIALKPRAGFGCRTRPTVGWSNSAMMPRATTCSLWMNLAAAQDRRTGHVGGIKPFEPFAVVCGDIFRHLVDARGGVDGARRRRCKARIPGQFGIARRPAKALPFGVGDGAAVR